MKAGGGGRAKKGGNDHGPAKENPVPAGPGGGRYPELVPPGVLHVAPPEIILERSGSPGRFMAREEVTVEVGSRLPLWSVSCTAKEAVGPGRTVIPPGSLFLDLSLSKRDIRRSYEGPPIVLSGPVVISEGRATGRRMVEVNSLRMGAAVEPVTAPGRYRGELTLALNDRETSREVVTEDIEFSLEVADYLNISLDPGGLVFDNMVPGVREAGNPVRLEVKTNCPSLKLELKMENLEEKYSKASIPGSSICLAAGDSETGAVRAVKKKNFAPPVTGAGGGAVRRTEEESTCSNSLVIELGPGTHTLFLFAKISVPLDVPPGRYSGSIEVNPTCVDEPAEEGGGG